MTERERLLKIIKDISPCKNNSCLNCCAEKDCFFRQIATALLENGVTILPCKVGDEVYEVDSGGKIYGSEIKRIVYDTVGGLAFDERAIGKSVFLNYDEAVKKVKEREK